MHATELAADGLSTARELGWADVAASDVPDLEWVPVVDSQALVTAAPLVASDLLAAALALGLSWQLSTWLVPAAAIDWPNLTWALMLALLLTNFTVGLYPGIGLSAIAELRRGSMAAASIAVVFAAVSWLTASASAAPFAVIVTTSLLVLPVAFLLRRLARAVLAYCAWWGQAALVVGDDERALTVYSFLARHPNIGLRPLGIVGYRPDDDGVQFGCFLGPMSHAGRLARRLGRPWIVVAGTDGLPSALEGAARQCVVLFSRLDGSPGLWRRAAACLDWPGEQAESAKTLPARWAKRAIDVAIAVAASIVLMPGMLVIAALIKLGSAGPVIFRQERVGLDGRRFICWKFRTMVVDGKRVLEEYLDACPERRAAWERDHKLPHDPRVTAIGRLLRKTSLDELPQLWNVLRGEMSIVGPRPILASEIPDFGDDFAAFSSVVPGITGLWQVSGRNRTTYAEHIELDSFYARHWSLWLDLYILVLTPKVVLLRQGAY